MDNTKSTTLDTYPLLMCFIYPFFDDFVDDQQRIKTSQRKNKKSKNKSSSTATRGCRTGFPAKPLDFSALLNVSYLQLHYV